MAAAATDLLQEVGIRSATTLDSPGYTIGDTSITVVSVSTWPTATGITFAMDEVDADGVQVPGTYNEYVGVKSSATSITSVSHQNGTNQDYTAGATTRVYIPVSAERENRIVEWGLTEHEQDGTHGVELVTSRTEDTNPDPDADFLLTYDTSAAALKKVKPSNLSGGLSGWTSNVLPSVSSVTNNGNRSYDVTFGSTVASYLTPGMRLRTTRTVTSPTQCTSLNGTTQYYNKTSPNKRTFTDDWNAGAYIKLASYNGTFQTIISSKNGTQGWEFRINQNGQVEIAGYNAATANYHLVTSYQSVPLNRWVHVAAEQDMSATTTVSSTTNYIMIDGVDVPAVVTRGGTNPTALVQAGNLEVGSQNGGALPFNGKLAQVFYTQAKVTQAQIRSEYMCQSISASATNLGSAYSFNASITDINTTTPNDLTAQGSAVATNADSPFSVDATGTPGGSYDYAIVTKVATTTATVQVPEGCTIPTSGGVSAVDLSSVKSPFGMPVDSGRWKVNLLWRTQNTAASNATFAAFTGMQFGVPVGAWTVGYNFGLFAAVTTATYWNLSSTSITGLAETAVDPALQARSQSPSAAVSATQNYLATLVSTTSALTYTMYTLGATASNGVLGTTAKCEIFAEFSLL
jgi:hypothetical protein